MNIIFRSLLIISTLFCAASIYAGDLKVMVSPFEGSPSDKELARKATLIVAKEVMRLKGFTFVPPTDFIRDTIGAHKTGALKFTSLEDEYSDKKMERLEKITEPHRGLQNLDKGLKAADITIGGKVERIGNKVRVEPMVADMKGLDHDIFSVVMECDEDDLEDELPKSVRMLLNKIR